MSAADEVRKRVVELLKRGWNREPTEDEIEMGVLQDHLCVLIDGKPGPITLAAVKAHGSCPSCSLRAIDLLREKQAPGEAVPFPTPEKR